MRIRQTHFFLSVDSRSAATSTPSFANASIRALESFSSNCIFAAEPPAPVKPKTTRIFFRRFFAPGRAATKATRSRLRTVPLGRLTRLFFMPRIVRLAIYSATEKFRPGESALGSFNQALRLRKRERPTFAESPARQSSLSSTTRAKTGGKGITLPLVHP